MFFVIDVLDFCTCLALSLHRDCEKLKNLSLKTDFFIKFAVLCLSFLKFQIKDQLTINLLQTPL